jgi:hypothetical protein
MVTDGGTPMMYGDCGFGGGNIIWAFLLFALLGGNGWGGNNRTNDTWTAQQFSQLDGGIRSLQSGLCDSSFALNNAIKDGMYANSMATESARNQIANGLSTTTYELASKIDGNRFALQECCCTTQRAIDGVNFNSERNTNAIIQSNNINTQKILDVLCANEKNGLARELAETQRQLSEARIIGAMKPQAPIPAYRVPSPYTSYADGCGCACYS